MNKCPFCNNPINNEFVSISIFNELEKQLAEQMNINEFYKKSANEQVQLLLTKYWLTHTNDTVHDTFGCNYVPNAQMQDKARSMVDINALSLTSEQLEQINKNTINNVMRGYLNYAT